jgi:hypothetical protein
VLMRYDINCENLPHWRQSSAAGPPLPSADDRARLRQFLEQRQQRKADLVLAKEHPSPSTRCYEVGDRSHLSRAGVASADKHQSAERPNKLSRFKRFIMTRRSLNLSFRRKRSEDKKLENEATSPPLDATRPKTLSNHLKCLLKIIELDLTANLDDDDAVKTILRTRRSTKHKFDLLKKLYCIKMRDMHHHNNRQQPSHKINTTHHRRPAAAACAATALQHCCRRSQSVDHLVVPKNQHKFSDNFLVYVRNNMKRSPPNWSYTDLHDINKIERKFLLDNLFNLTSNDDVTFRTTSSSHSAADTGASLHSASPTAADDAHSPPFNSKSNSNGVTERSSAGGDNGNLVRRRNIRRRSSFRLKRHSVGSADVVKTWVYRRRCSNILHLFFQICFFSTSSKIFLILTFIHSDGIEHYFIFYCVKLDFIHFLKRLGRFMVGLTYF